MNKRCILIMDDDEETREILKLGLSEHGFEVLETANAQDALNVCLQQSPDLAILDVYVPGESGITAALNIRQQTSTPFLFLSASDEREIVQQAVSAGALGYLVKPIDIFQLVPAVEAALVRANDIKALKEAHESLSQALAEGHGIDVAVGLIMERFRVSKEDAFNLLRSQATKHHLKLSEVAEDIIAASEQINLTPMQKPDCSGER